MSDSFVNEITSTVTKIADKANESLKECRNNREQDDKLTWHHNRNNKGKDFKNTKTRQGRDGTKYIELEPKTKQEKREWEKKAKKKLKLRYK